MSPSLSDERELFTHPYPSVEPDALWSALKRSLETMDLRGADDEQRSARFGTPPSMTSWGEYILASVEPGESGGARLNVRGRPKAANRLLGSTKWGEDIHSRNVEKDLVAAIDEALATGAG